MTRTLTTLLAAASALLSGCAAPPAGSPAGEAPPPPAGWGSPAFATALVDGPGMGAEPTLLAGPDGTLWIAAPHSEAGGLAVFLVDAATPVPAGTSVSVFRSRDGGVSWTRLPFSTPDASWFDTDLAMDDRGRLYLAAVSAASAMPPGLVEIAFHVYVSEDGGDTWQRSAPAIVGRPDRPWIAAWGDGELAASWTETDPPRRVWATRSHDAGATWSEPVEVARPRSWAGPLVRDPARGLLVFPSADLETTIVTWWPEDDPGGVRNATVPTLPDSDPYMHPTLAIDAGGAWHLAWAAAPGRSQPKTPSGEGASVWIANSFDGGQSWTAPLRVGPTDGNSIFPWVVAGDPGRLAVAYFRTQTGGHPNRTPGTWFAEATLVDLRPEGTSVNVRLSETPVHRGGICGYGSRCTGSPPDPDRLDRVGDSGLLDLFEAALAPDGRLVVAFPASVEAGPAGPGATAQTRLFAARQTGGGLLSG